MSRNYFIWQMDNALGVDYYRIVNETEKKDRSEIYVRDGSVFGVLEGEGLIEQMGGWCTEAEQSRDVFGLLELLKSKSASGVIAWVFADKGRRMMKVGALPGNSVAVVRGGKKIWLFENGSGQVMVGEIREGDKVCLGDKEIVEAIDVEDLTKEMITGGAALVLVVGKNKAIPQKDEEMLVGDRVVGNEGLKKKLASAKLSWKSLTEKWQSASRLRVQDRDEKRHRWILFVGAVFLLVLVVSVTLGLIKVRQDKANSAFAAVFEPLEKKRSEAETLLTLNPVGARELLRGVREEIAAKKGQFVGSNFEERIGQLEKRTEETWIRISGEQKTELNLFFSLGLVRSEMRGDSLAFDGKNLLVLDKTSGVVAKISYPEKKQEMILGKGEDQGWLDVTLFGENNIVLTKTGLMVTTRIGKNELKFDAAVTDPVALDMFGTGIYVLDKGSSEVWRFGLAEGVVGERRRWFGTEVKPNLSEAVDLAIDADVWVGLRTGKIMRFRRGNMEKFDLGDVPDKLEVDRIAVSDNARRIALLDTKKKRIALFDKESGAYSKQLLAEELEKASDLVWTKENELMVLVENKLYLVSI